MDFVEQGREVKIRDHGLQIAGKVDEDHRGSVS
jgi:hypothetical protein